MNRGRVIFWLAPQAATAPPGWRSGAISSGHLLGAREIKLRSYPYEFRE